MRHGHGLRKLNRTSSHRLAMLRNLMNSLIAHEAIKTTVPKAKELRRVVEPMITLAKESTVANRRLAFDRLRDRDSVSKLFDVLGPRFKARPGGYTRIVGLITQRSKVQILLAQPIKQLSAVVKTPTLGLAFCLVRGVSRMSFVIELGKRLGTAP